MVVGDPGFVFNSRAVENDDQCWQGILVDCIVCADQTPLKQLHCRISPGFLVPSDHTDDIAEDVEEARIDGYDGSFTVNLLSILGLQKVFPAVLEPIFLMLCSGRLATKHTFAVREEVWGFGTESVGVKVEIDFTGSGQAGR